MTDGQSSIDGISEPQTRKSNPSTPSLGYTLLVKVPFFACGVILLAAVGINIVNIAGRYILNAPVSWAEEVMSYIIIWGVFISAGALTYQGLHLRMDLLVQNVRGVLGKLLGAITVALIVFCSLFVMFQSIQVVQLYAMTGETSMGARVPLVYTHTALLVGFFLMAIAAIIRVRAYVNGRFD
jgi:TRAP-type C4-dicarboxylate transport system permease small subunit